MIRKTLQATKLATYSVDLPRADLKGMPAATGTGFFVSPEGWFVTAAHVVTENGEPNGPVRKDVNQGWLMKERGPTGFIAGMCQYGEVDWVDAATDFALLKLDFAANANKDGLKGRAGFPYITVSRRALDEGEPVYSFGYPLSDSQLLADSAAHTVGITRHSPRLTSAVISATQERTEVAWSPEMPRVYVLDKALNYGNSGGPIVAAETGHVHALCSRFQPVFVPQHHLRDGEGRPIHIMMPSLYGIVSSLANETVLHELERRGVPIVDT